MIHIVGLDLDPQLPSSVLASQQEWLDQDLAAAVAIRGSVPWIIVTSHSPLYNAKFAGQECASAAHYLGDAGESYTTSGHEFVQCEADGCRTVGDVLRSQRGWLEPLLEKYGVDVYDAGHVHSYDSTWPICRGELCGGTKSFADPNGTVHITEGNGGVPDVDATNTLGPCTSDSDYRLARNCGTGGAYGRFIAWNATALTYEHVENPTGKVTD